MQRSPQPESHNRQDCAEEKGDTPAPAAQILFAEDKLQHHHRQHRQQLAADKRNVLKGCVKTFAPFERHLAHIGCAGAIFAAYRQSLKHARQQQDRRGRDADTAIARQAGDDQRAEAHHAHRNKHRFFTSVPIADIAKQPAADRTH